MTYWVRFKIFVWDICKVLKRNKNVDLCLCTHHYINLKQNHVMTFLFCILFWPLFLYFLFLLAWLSLGLWVLFPFVVVCVFLRQGLTMLPSLSSFHCPPSAGVTAVCRHTWLGYLWQWGIKPRQALYCWATPIVSQPLLFSFPRLFFYFSFLITHLVTCAYIVWVISPRFFKKSF
jgi:hypothetical protein